MRTRTCLLTLALAAAMFGQGTQRRVLQGLAVRELAKTPSAPVPQAEARTKKIDSLIAAAPHNCDTTPEPDASRNAGVRFYGPFAASDTIEDVWCRMQTLKTGNPLQIYISTDESRTALVKTDFALDGTVRAGKNAFAKAFLTVLSDMDGPNLWRATHVLRQGNQDIVPRPLPKGILPGAPEAEYVFYDGSLEFVAENVEISGLKFTLTVYFSPDVGLIPRHFAKTADYLHLPMANWERGEVRTGDCRQCVRNESVLASREVGFPWTIRMVSLYSEDPRVGAAAPKLKKSIETKYAKWIKQSDVADPQDKNHRTTHIVDDVITLRIHEGRTESDRDYFQADYLHNVRSPLGAFDNKAFDDFVKQASERYTRSIAESLKGPNPL